MSVQLRRAEEGAIIMFMGKVSGAHLNPAVSLAFSLRGDFPWRRVPGARSRSNPPSGLSQPSGRREERLIGGHEIRVSGKGDVIDERLGLGEGLAVETGDFTGELRYEVIKLAVG